LEEPPERGVLFLISHAPGRLLPTIRSRCRRLRFHGWAESDAAAFVAARAGVSPDQAARLAHMAGGAPGRALELAGRQALEADHTARLILQSLPDVDSAALLSLADTFRGPEGAQRFELLFERLADQVHEMAAVTLDGGGAGVERWVGVWERLSRLPREAEGLNLDRADAFWSTIADLRDAASHS
jgi:DNA polymerase-3 subunit delta'